MSAIIFKLSDLQRLDTIIPTLRENKKILDEDEYWETTRSLGDDAVGEFYNIRLESLTTWPNWTSYEREMLQHLRIFLLPELARICLEYANSFALDSRYQQLRDECIATKDELLEAIKFHNTKEQYGGQTAAYEVERYFDEHPCEKEMILILL